jgi:DNA-binding CsgD family transcriptional regulator
MGWLLAQSGPSASAYRPLFNALMLALVFVLLGVWYLAGLDMLVSYALVSMARNMVLMLLFLASLKLVVVSGKSPWFVFGIARGAYEAAVVVGIVGYARLMDVLGPISLGEDLVYLTALCVLVFLTSCFFSMAQCLGARGLEASDNAGGDAAAAPPQKAQADDGHADLRARYALNDREFEVLMLFYCGDSKRRIAELLGISENTVRWYIQQLYARMDVHSRDELHELMDAR